MSHRIIHKHMVNHCDNMYMIVFGSVSSREKVQLNNREPKRRSSRMPHTSHLSIMTLKDCSIMDKDTTGKSITLNNNSSRSSGTMYILNGVGPERCENNVLPLSLRWV